MSGKTIYPVILSGGSGTRLWPLARTSLPKQFLRLQGTRTLFQEAVLRASVSGAERPIIICGEKHRFLIAEQMRELEISPRAIVVEPEARNTAPAAAIAALLVRDIDQEGIVLILPADHEVKDRESFANVIAMAAATAESGRIATLGLRADSPETGYGYIQRGERLSVGGAYAVKTFVEKPDSARASRFVASGDYYWNSGIFVSRADVLLDELKVYVPDLVHACRNALSKGSRDADFVRLDRASFENVENVSLDIAVMEKTAKAAVVSCEFGWSDVGSWATAWALHPHDNRGNAVVGDAILLDSAQSLVHSSGQLVAMVGVDNLAVVATEDAVLVAHKDRAQEVKALVDLLRAEHRPEAEEHVKVDRPWGSYQSIDAGPGYQVKRISVKPGGQLSLQMHHRRAEHWVVVQGMARVTRDDNVLMLNPNQSIFIPLGAKHRLENPGDVPLELIEVQCGDYLGEDDIVRFEDVYGRADGPNKA